METYGKMPGFSAGRSLLRDAVSLLYPFYSHQVGRHHIDDGRAGYLDVYRPANLAVPHRAQTHGADVDFQFARDDLRNPVHHAGRIFCHDAHRSQKTVPSGGAPPSRFENAVGILLLQPAGVGAVAAVDGDAGRDGGESEDVVAENGVAALGQFVVEPLDGLVDDQRIALLFLFGSGFGCGLCRFGLGFEKLPGEVACDDLFRIGDVYRPVGYCAVELRSRLVFVVFGQGDDRIGMLSFQFFSLRSSSSRPNRATLASSSRRHALILLRAFAVTT